VKPKLEPNKFDALTNPEDINESDDETGSSGTSMLKGNPVPGSSGAGETGSSGTSMLKGNPVPGSSGAGETGSSSSPSASTKAKAKKKGWKPSLEQDKKGRKIFIVEDEDEFEEIIAQHQRAMTVATLTRIGESINPCTKEQKGWKKLSLAVDSGACENVIDANEEVPNYPVVEGRAARMGVKYASATGEEIPNLGEITIPMVTMEGSRRKMKMQAAEVSKPLASVKRICEAGHTVVFDEEGSFMYNKTTGEINYFREESGNYMLDVWVPPNSAADFHRQ
jgi:hypothetical protein